MPAEHNYNKNGMKETTLKHMGEAQTYTFYDAMREVSNGKLITRLAWNTNDIYCRIVDTVVCIRLDNQFKQWIISDEDLLAIDWVVMPEQQPETEIIEPNEDLRCTSCGVRKGEKHKDWCEDDLGEEDE